MNKFSIAILSLICCLLIVSCNNTTSKKYAISERIVQKDLDSILIKKRITALINYSPSSYFIYKGNPMGFEYELLKKYTDHIGIELEVIPIRNRDSIFSELNNGKADIIAANLTVTEERLNKISFTEPILITQQVLIQRKPEDWRKRKKSTLKKLLVQSPLDLVGKTITVRKESSFYSRLQNLSNEIGGKINIQTVSGELTMEELIEKVATEEIKYTIADKNIANINQWQFPNIDAHMIISLDQNIAWGTRKNANKLTISLNQWLVEFKKTKNFKFLYNKYFRNRFLYNKRVNDQYYTLNSGQISPYDEVLQKHVKKIGWDWELLASMIYQESHFNNKAIGWGNSFGLMQFMPATGERYGVDSTSSPTENIIAGINYLNYLDQYWAPIITNINERIKFVLASYNVGPGHILDARRLAEKYGKDPFVWDDNVAYFLLNKSKAKYYQDEVVRNGYCKGFITFDYVNEIISRYEHYKKIISESNTNLTSKQPI